MYLSDTGTEKVIESTWTICLGCVQHDQPITVYRKGDAVNIKSVVVVVVVVAVVVFVVVVS